MADFVAVLRKTIGALGDNTPEMREKVYDKARATIEAKLTAISPPPPVAVVDRQRKALEDAIAVLRADYADAGEAEKDDGLEDAFAALERPAVPPPPPVERPAASSPAAVPPPLGATGAPSVAVDPAAETDDVAEAAPAQPEAVVAAAKERQAESRGSGRHTGLIAALILLLVLAGGGYAVWMNKDDFSRLVGLGPTPAETPAPEGAETAEELVEAEPEPAEEAVEEEVAALPPPAEEPPAEPVEPPPAAQQPSAAEPEKFTQRLQPDGTEVDEGPAGGQRTIGEGTSVAAVVQPGDPATASDADADTAETAEQPAEGENAQPETPAVAVGQRAIFYEERTSAAQGSAEAGSIVWSTVQESPGGDLPPEPAIRAEATIPGKDVQLRMTIRRNGDQTLPASHIIEMIFLTPDGFEGGAISNVSRISFKETEQAAGNPLIGIPAKIADGFFLIALGDAPAEIEANTALLRRQSWVDIPIVYQSGRRALLSLEKGIPGDRVFQDVLRAWEEATSG